MKGLNHPNIGKAHTLCTSQRAFRLCVCVCASMRVCFTSMCVSRRKCNALNKL